jgi:hypothetical protein
VVTIRLNDRVGVPGGVPFLINARTGMFNTELVIGEEFYIKIRLHEQAEPLTIYDETRYCQFILPSTASAHAPLFKIGQAEKAANGRMTYMKASFDKDGNIQVKLNSFTLKLWY